MKNRKTAVINTFKLSLFCLSSLLSLSSCSKQSETNTKMESQSGNWKVTVLSVKKIPKRTELERKNDPSTISQYDLLEVAFNAELLGAGGKIAIPKAVLVDDKGQKTESVGASQALPDRISKMQEGVAKEEAMDKFLLCFSPAPGADPCPLTTGEKLSLSSSFVDPKEYANLKLVFGDVPPIPLKVPAGDTLTPQRSPSY